MEKSRAIELLEHLAWDRDIERNPYGDALNMAIKALKAQLSCGGTTSDLISRQAALDALNEYFARIGKLKRRGLTEGEKAISLDTVGTIKTLPSAQPEPQWILITERLPRDGSWNIFTDGKNISVERYKADAIDHFFPPGRWFQLEDVIAWMPLPEPYKGGEKDE